jgi:hypothetical protein
VTHPTIPVYVNASRVDVPAGSTALDAVRAWSADAAAQVSGGGRGIVDSRGLPLDPASPMSAGSILRLVLVRDRGDADDAAR